MVAKKKTTSKVTTIYSKKAPTKKQKEKSVVIHYHRYDKDYEDWGIHLWDGGEHVIDDTIETEWEAPLLFEDEDSLWKKVTIFLKNGYGKFGFLVHKGEEKDPGVDMEFIPNSRKKNVWLVQGIPEVFSLKSAAQAAIKKRLP